MAASHTCVVFDLDDTLYLERDFVFSGYHAVDNHLRTSLGRYGFFDKAVLLFESGQRTRIFDTALPQLGVAPEPLLIRELVYIYRTHSPSLKLPADTLPCLDQIAGQFSLGLITDGPVESQQAKLDALGITSRFTTLVMTDSWGPEFHKPHPRAFAHMESQFSGCAKQFVYVADNPAKDFATPQKRSWHTIRIRRPLGLYSAVEGPADLPELPDLTLLPAFLQSTE